MTSTETFSVEQTTMTRYRVVQWATGTIGAHALRSIVEHPNLDLVGVRVYSDDKRGRDAGDLCGLSRPTGVRATTDVAEILGVGADCVLYTPIVCDPEEVCRILEAGINVVTTCGDFHNPSAMDPTLHARVESACRIGKASLHSTGSSPGFITEALPLALTSIQRRLNRLTIHEYADMSQRDSSTMLFDIMGFGRPAGAFNEDMLAYIAGHFGPSLRLLADTLGCALDDVHVTGELAHATKRVEIAAGVIEAGTVAAQRITVAGFSRGQVLLTFIATWYCTDELAPVWEVRETGWHVIVDGDAPMDVDIRFPVPLDRMAQVAPGYTANRAVNAITVVCDALPGIRTTADLPHIVATLY